MEGAAPLLAIALIVPALLGGAGLLVVRKRRVLGIVLLCAMMTILAIMAVFTFG